MSNTQPYTVTIEIYKNKKNRNITWTPKHKIEGDKESGIRAVNLTGTCTFASDIRGADGEDLSKQILGKRTTIAFTAAQAKSLLAETLTVFNQRASLGDKNPVVHLTVKAFRVSPLPNTIYVANIRGAEVISNQDASIDSDVFKAITNLNATLEQENPRKANFISNLVTVLTTDVKELGRKKAAK